MSPTDQHVDLPEAVLQVMGQLERWTGRITRRRAVLNILALGLLMTALAVGSVWWVEQHRQKQALDAATARLQALVQTQIDHEVALVRQLADWASYQSFDGDRSTAWQSGGVSLIGSDALKAGLLHKLVSLGNQRAKLLENCLRQANPQRQGSLCRAFGEAGQADAWFLVERVKLPGDGWVIKPLDGLDRGWALDDGMHWRVRAQMAPPSELAPPRAPMGTGAVESGVPVGHIDVHLADDSLPLAVYAAPRAQTWQDTWTRYTAMGIAASAGLLFTLGGLHVYLMLISTRMRAKDMALDMSATLERTQSRNQAVMDSAPDAIVLTDERGLIRWCNQATVSIFGRTLEQLQGQGVGTILPELGDIDMAAWFNDHGFSNRVIGHETRGVRNEGTAFPVALSASRVTREGETIQALFVRDTTDAKWAEQELSLRDRALASSADGVVITSMTLPNQPIIYVNQAFEQITGYESHEVLGINCRLLQREDRDQPGLAAMRRAIAEGKPCQVVLRNYRKDGSLFYNELAISPVLSPEGALTHYVGVQNDITERMAAEQVLALRTERLNAVFELSPDGFVVLDKRGEVSIVNPAFERMTGMMAADLVGQSLHAFEEGLMMRCAVSDISERSVAAAIDGSPAGADEARPNRRLLHLHAPQSRTLLQRVRHGGQDNETVMYFRDVTHELEVDRMKSEFLAMAAHELRTPMVSIFGFTELLLKRPFSDERRNEVLGTIHKQASILINLINELLDLARIEARRGKDFNRKLQPVGVILDQALDGLKVPGDRRKVKLHLDAPDALVWADTDKLGQAVLNVLSNAYKYSPTGGDIVLRQHLDSRQQRVILEIEDHGLGMSPEHTARVFERFFRADPSGNIPGTGLGMSLVKEIMDLHCGEVRIHSTLGQGTTVTLSVPGPAPTDAASPLADEAPEAHEAVASLPPPADAGVNPAP
jgi:PAS domain S-box-containing protein